MSERVYKATVGFDRLLGRCSIAIGGGEGHGLGRDFNTRKNLVRFGTTIVYIVRSTFFYGQTTVGISSAKPAIRGIGRV